MPPKSVILWARLNHHAISARIEELNRVTHNLAENMMNTAVRGALKGTKIE
jgi:hypothetical protein